MKDLFGTYFSEILSTAIRLYVSESSERISNHGAPMPFGENHLRAVLQRYLDSGRLQLPPHGHHLVIERKLQGDFKEIGERHGCVDYFVASEQKSSSYVLGEVLATCEVSGPARPEILQGSKENWFPKILRDIKKQTWRAQHAPEAAHYVAIMIKTSERSGYEKRFKEVLQNMLKISPDTRITRSYCSEVEQVPNLRLEVLRTDVAPKS